MEDSQRGRDRNSYCNQWVNWSDRPLRSSNIPHTIAELEATDFVSLQLHKSKGNDLFIESCHISLSVGNALVCEKMRMLCCHAL